jgi:hypothetical protein
MSAVEQLIERLAAEAHQAHAKLVERAYAEIAFRFAFLRRSNGQKRRFERQRQRQGVTA